MILLLVPAIMNNPVKAGCMISSNSDWPSAPCYGCPGCIPSKEKQREEWNPYYQYKGAIWMEMMKAQMIGAMKNGTIEDWVTGKDSNYNVWRYYYLNDQAPFFRSSVSGLNDEHPYFPPPLQQLTTGIAPKDVACKKGLNLVLNAEDGSPACVKPEHIASLYLRGWITHPANGTMFFVIKPNTVGQILVQYTDPLQDIDAELNTRLYDGNTGQEVHTANLKVSVTPDTVRHTESLIATYNVVAQNTTGIYWLQVASCQFIPIAVASDSSQITSSDLQFAISGWRCPVPFLQFHVVNVSNMTLEYRQD